MAVRVHALERHPVRVVVVLDDLNPVRSYSLERFADVAPASEVEAEVQEWLRRPGILPGVQRQVEAVRVADDDRTVRAAVRDRARVRA